MIKRERERERESIAVLLERELLLLRGLATPADVLVVHLGLQVAIFDDLGLQLTDELDDLLHRVPGVGLLRGPANLFLVCVLICIYVMLCYVMLCYVMLCYVMSYHVMSCHIMLCYVMCCC